MMTARIHWLKDQAAYKTLMGLGDYVYHLDLEQSLIDLVIIRVSQINHCAFCLDMHTKDARAIGETEQRIYALNAWEDAPYFSERERAALAWAEAVTLLTEGFVPDAVYEQAHAQFSDAEMIQLTMAIVSMNTWNRMNVSFRIPAGDYQSRRKPAAEASVTQAG